MSGNDQRICLWIFIFGFVATVIGIIPLANFFPPPSPALGADAVVDLYVDNTNMKRLGFALMMLGNGLYFSIVAVIYAQMRKIQSASPLWAHLQLISGAANGILLLLPSLFFTAAAFRLERDPEVVAALNDVAWFIAVMPVSSFMLQQFAIAMAILSDSSKSPMFPRWVAYMNLWTAFLYLPAFLDTFFKVGPFAWNGVLAFWIPAVVFGAGWVPVMLYYLFINTKGKLSEEESGYTRHSSLEG